jgi:hypothetical protein
MKQPPVRVYSHIRDLTGIIDSIYGTTSVPPSFNTHEIGRHASYYLQAHGYMQETIDHIALVWMNSADVDEFVETLNVSGMAATEIRWLWDLIRHADDCGF